MANDDARLARTKRVELFKEFLAVVERTDRIQNQNIVERPAECGDGCGVFRVPTKNFRFG